MQDKTVKVNTLGVIMFLDELVEFGREADLKKFDRMEDYRQDGVLMHFYTRLLKSILGKCDLSYMTFDGDFAVRKSVKVGRKVYTETKWVEATKPWEKTGEVEFKIEYSYQVDVLIRCIQVDSFNGEVTYTVTIGSPYLCDDVKDGMIDYNPKVPKNVELKIESLSNTIEDAINSIKQVLEDDEMSKKLSVLEIFYDSLHHYNLVNVSTDSAVTLAKLYNNACRKIPAFKAANVVTKAEVLTRAAETVYTGIEKRTTGDIYAHAKSLFYAMHDAGLIKRVVYRPVWSDRMYVMTNEYEQRMDRYPIGLRPSERKNGWYFVKDDLVWIKFSFIFGPAKNVGVTYLHPHEIWSLFTEGLRNYDYDGEDHDYEH